MKKEIELNNLPNFAKEVLELLEDKNCIYLVGDLGSGKTTFTKEIAKQLGVKEEITSPTFTLMKEYQIENSKFKNLIHIDLYRLENSQEIDFLKIPELVADKNNLVLIEWADKMDSQNKGYKTQVSIYFNYKDQNTRVIEILNG